MNISISTVQKREATKKRTSHSEAKSSVCALIPPGKLTLQRGISYIKHTNNVIFGKNKKRKNILIKKNKHTGPELEFSEKYSLQTKEKYPPTWLCLSKQ